MKKSISKVGFYVSVCVIIFIYGTAVGKWGWFPASFLDRAVSQARTMNVSWFGKPLYLRPQVYDRKGTRAPLPEEVYSGLTVITSSWQGPGGWDPELRLVNETGEVLHNWRIDRDEFFQGGLEIRKKKPTETDIQGSYLLPNGDILFNLEYVGLARMDACGNVEWTLKEGNHHSIARAEDGSFWVPGVSETRRAGSENYPNGFPGFGGQKIWLDRILRISEKGNILDDIKVLDILYKNDMERLLFRLGGKHDTHLNDIEALSSSMADKYPEFESGDLLVSLRNVNLIFVFDPESKKVKWHTTKPFIAQHDPDFIGDGWIGIFDNNTDGTGGELFGGSRIIGIQPHTDSVEVLFPTKHSEPFYTNRRGKWQMLKNGNMLLTEARAGRVVEVNEKGRTVWEWVYPPTEGSKVASTTKAHRISLTRKEVASWPCSSIGDSVTTSTQSRPSP